MPHRSARCLADEKHVERVQEGRNGETPPARPAAQAQPDRHGNLPSKKFYADSAVSIEQVRAEATELIGRMRALHRPFILGTECDVLQVPGSESTIWAKVDAFMQVGVADTKHIPRYGPPPSGRQPHP